MPKKKATKVEPLDPPDMSRCQAEKPNGVTFLTCGGRPGMVRCTNSPTILAVENKPGEDGQIGSMTLCGDCLEQFQRQMPAGFATFKVIQ